MKINGVDYCTLADTVECPNSFKNEKGFYKCKNQKCIGQIQCEKCLEYENRNESKFSDFSEYELKKIAISI